MVCVFEENNRPVILHIALNHRHHIVWIGTRVLWSSGQRSHTGVTRCYALSRLRQCAIGSAGTDDDPVSGVTAFGGKFEAPGEGCTRLQFDGVATESSLQRCLEIAACVNRDNAARSR